MQSETTIFLTGSLGLVLFGIAVLVAVRLISEPRDLMRDDALQITLTVSGSLLIAIGSLVLCLVPFGLLGLLLWFAGLFALGEILLRRRVAEQNALLWTLTVAAERQIPLVPAVEAFARERARPFALRARMLSRQLTAGTPLPDALEHSRGLLPPDVLPIVRVGYESGALGAALRQAVTARELHEPLWHAVASKIIYLGALLVFAFAVVWFLILYIIPRIARIFNSFEMDLPVTTRWLIGAAEWIELIQLLFVLLLAAGLLLLLYAVLRYGGWIRWELPGTRRLVRRLDTAAILDTLSLAARHQRPVPEVIKTLAFWYPKASIRRRLEKVLGDVYAGADWCESLHQRGLIKHADLAILQAARRAGNLPWALGEMADSNRRRLIYRLQMLMQVLFPPIVVLLGLVVLVIVVSCFLPIISLIQGLL